MLVHTLHSAFEDRIEAFDPVCRDIISRHTHPGAAFVYVVEGTITVEHEGRPTTTYKAGDAIHIEANKVHEGINAGSVPVKLAATFVVEKGKPLASSAP